MSIRLILFAVCILLLAGCAKPNGSPDESPDESRDYSFENLRMLPLNGYVIEDLAVAKAEGVKKPMILARKSGDWKKEAASIMDQFEPTKLYKSDKSWIGIKRIEGMEIVVSVGAGREQTEDLDAMFFTKKETNVVKVIAVWDWFPERDRSAPAK